jgi:hypothetical protein
MSTNFCQKVDIFGMLTTTYGRSASGVPLFYALMIGIVEHFENTGFRKKNSLKTVLFH